jgi:hypothetical protein
LRNVWGDEKFEWRGDFNKNSHLWTKEINEIVSNTINNAFWVTFSDFT